MVDVAEAAAAAAAAVVAADIAGAHTAVADNDLVLVVAAHIADRYPSSDYPISNPYHHSQPEEHAVPPVGTPSSVVLASRNHLLCLGVASSASASCRRGR